MRLHPVIGNHNMLSFAFAIATAGPDLPPHQLKVCAFLNALHIDGKPERTNWPSVHRHGEMITEYGHLGWNYECKTPFSETAKLLDGELTEEKGWKLKIEVHFMHRITAVHWANGRDDWHLDGLVF